MSWLCNHPTNNNGLGLLNNFFEDLLLCMSQKIRSVCDKHLHSRAQHYLDNAKYGFLIWEMKYAFEAEHTFTLHIWFVSGEVLLGVIVFLKD